MEMILSQNFSENKCKLSQKYNEIVIKVKWGGLGKLSFIKETIQNRLNFLIPDWVLITHSQS